MTQKTKSVVVTARRAVVAVALAGGTCWHTTALAQSEEGHTISPIRLQVGDWVLVATLDAEELLDGFVAVQPDPVDLNAIDHIWFQFQEGELAKSYAYGLDAAEAIRAIKGELSIADEQDALWPISVEPDPSPPVFVKKPMGRGVSKFDPMNELLKTLPPVAAKDALEELEHVGWRAANIDIFTSECSDEEILGLIGVNLAVAHTIGEVEERIIDLSSISDDCPKMRELALAQESAPSRPEIQIVNVGEYERLDPRGDPYFRVGDTPVFLAIAEGSDGEELPTTMTWNDGAEYVSGTPLDRSGMLCLSAFVTDAMGRTTAAHRYLQVHPFEYTSVDASGSYTLSPDGTGGSEMTAEINVTPLFVDADQINAGVVYLKVQYPDPSSEQGFAIKDLWIDGMYDGPGSSLSPESAVAYIQDNTLVATLSGSIPAETIIGATLVGHGIGYPDSFIFEDRLMLEQREDDGGDNGDGDDEGDGLDNDDFPGGTVTVDTNHGECWKEAPVLNNSLGFRANEMDASWLSCSALPFDFTADHWARYKNHTDGVNLLGNEAFAGSTQQLVTMKTRQSELGNEDIEDRFGEHWLLSYRCTPGYRPCDAKWIVTPNIRGKVTADVDVHWALDTFGGLVGSAGAKAQSALIGDFEVEGGIPQSDDARVAILWQCRTSFSLSWPPSFGWEAPDPLEDLEPQVDNLIISGISRRQEVDAGSPNNDEDDDGDGIGEGNTTFVKMYFENWMEAKAKGACAPAGTVLLGYRNEWDEDWYKPSYFTKARTETTSLSATFTASFHYQEKDDCAGAYHPPLYDGDGDSGG